MHTDSEKMLFYLRSLSDAATEAHLKYIIQIQNSSIDIDFNYDVLNHSNNYNNVSA